MEVVLYYSTIEQTIEGSNIKFLVYIFSQITAKSFLQPKSNAQLTFLSPFPPLNSFLTINSEHNCGYASFCVTIKPTF